MTRNSIYSTIIIICIDIIEYIVSVEYGINTVKYGIYGILNMNTRTVPGSTSATAV